MRFFWGERGTKTTMLFCIMNDHCEISRVIKYNRCRDLGNASKKFRNHWFNQYTISWGNLCSLCKVVCGCKAMQSE